MIVVLHPGLQTTVQDLGRRGWRAAGVPSGGAMDPWAARAANRLVGNAEDAALLEITLTGPALRFRRAARVAWVGGDFEAAIDGATAAEGRTHRLAEGATLELGRGRRGARAWLAVAGGVEVPEILGSRSTDLAGGFGGLDGRALAAGDRLTVGAPSGEPIRRALAAEWLASLAARRLRLLPGPDVEPVAFEALVASEWLASARSDRRGVRFERRGGSGAAPERAGERLSQGTLPGAVQAPPSGEAIVLGPDAPVTGGYPWLGQVAAADLGRLAHFAPGAWARFEATSFDEAEAALAARERGLAEALRG